MAPFTTRPATRSRLPRRAVQHARAGCAALVACLLLASPAAAEQTPQRIASISVCTDQLLALLVPPARIVSVTQHLRDPAFSNMPAAARGLTVNFGMAERILPDAPDLVLTQAFSNRRTAQLIAAVGVPVDTLPLADDLATVRRNVATLGMRLGVKARAAEILADLDARLERAAGPGEPDPPVIAIYGANGFTSGRGTLIDELVIHAGFRNLAAEMGISGPAELSLERLLTRRVDALLLPREGEEAPSLAVQQARHPAIRRLRRDLPTLTLPSRLWVCGTPHLVEAVEALATFRTRVSEHRRPADGH